VKATIVPLVTYPIPILDTLAQLLGKALGCLDAGLFWTVGKEWSYVDSWGWDCPMQQGQQVRNYELRLWGFELSYCR
jgi:hypothetical protein